MATPPKKPRYVSQEELQSQCEMQDPECLQEAIEENDSSTDSPCSSSFSSFAPSSVYTVSSGISRGELSADETSGPSENPQGAGSSSTSMASPPCSQSDQGSHQQSEEEPVNSQACPPVPCFCCSIHVKIHEVVQFLLLKYRMRELITREEILNRVLGSYQRYYPLIFLAASHFMLMVFGVEVKERDPSGHSYVLVPALDLTYDGMLTGLQGIPKTGLLIKVLCTVSLEGSSAREEVVWRALHDIGVCAENNHPIYGIARRLITEEFVQEGYLEYRQVPHSDPAHYEFLWGPRALAETNPMKFSMLVRNMYIIDPIDYPILYAKALKVQEMRV